MKEITIEDYLVKVAAELGYRAEKISPRGRRGRCDRVLVHPERSAIYIELKAPRKGVRKNSPQYREHVALRKMGFVVVTLNTKAKIDAFMATL